MSSYKYVHVLANTWKSFPQLLGPWPLWTNAGTELDSYSPKRKGRGVNPFVIAVSCRMNSVNGPLARYVKLRVAHAPGMPGTFSPPPLGSDPDMHHDTCATHVSWCMPGSLTSVFLWSRWRGKRSLHSRRMRNRQFYVSGKRPMAWAFVVVNIDMDRKTDSYSVKRKGRYVDEFVFITACGRSSQKTKLQPIMTEPSAKCYRYGWCYRWWG